MGAVLAVGRKISISLDRRDKGSIQRSLNALVKMVDYRFGLQESFELFVKGLIDLAEVQFFRTVWHVLQVDEVAVCHVVRAFENLVLLQIHLECRLVRKVV